MSATREQNALWARLERRYEEKGRFVNRKRHECGCVTKFDVIGWCSVTVVACEFHSLLVQRHGMDGAGGGDGEGR